MSRHGLLAAVLVVSLRRLSHAAAVKLPPRLSPSQIVAWKQCPLLFKYRYIDKIKEPTTTALARGISAHDALQNLFDLPAGERNEEALHNLFRASWSKLRKQEKYAVLFGNDRSAERQWGLESLSVLSNYLELERPDDLSPLSRETRFSTKISDGPELVGIIDRLDRDIDGKLVVVDYKTGKAPDVARYPPQVQARIVDEKFLQLRIYAVLLARSAGEVPSGLRLLFLGSCDEVRVACDEKAVERTEEEIASVLIEMKASSQSGCFDPKTGPLCDWCNFKPSCPAFQGRMV
jgi:putative RecB family exonuclease